MKHDFLKAVTVVVIGIILSSCGWFDNKNTTELQLQGTTLDAKTNLIWKRCSAGQKWNGKTCTGKAKKMKWQEAQDYAKSHKFASKSNWRVPTIKELNTLIYCSNGKKLKYEKDGFYLIKSEGSYGCKSDTRGNYQQPTINTTIFPNTPAYTYSFWSSSPHSPGYAWRLHFSNGFDFYSYRTSALYVRLVRDSAN